MGGGWHSCVVNGNFRGHVLSRHDNQYVVAFPLIMTIGIIVDDAIVVGEHSATLTERGEDAETAAEGGALSMMMPITAAALTTLAAFIPMLLITGVTGQFVRYSVGIV